MHPSSYSPFISQNKKDELFLWIYALDNAVNDMMRSYFKYMYSNFVFFLGCLFCSLGWDLVHAYGLGVKLVDLQVLFLFISHPSPVMWPVSLNLNCCGYCTWTTVVIVVVEFSERGLLKWRDCVSHCVYWRVGWRLDLCLITCTCSFWWWIFLLWMIYCMYFCCLQ